jgi:hypothetical protein
MDQTEFSKRCSIDRKTLIKMENSEHVQHYTVRKVAGVLGVRPQSLANVLGRTANSVSGVA